MLDIDFLPVESVIGDGGKSGDAVCIRFTDARDEVPIVVIIDGGFGAIGDRVIQHVRKIYGTEKVDLVVSTHPDADHLNGLIPILEQLEVDELLLHLPWQHHQNVQEYSNIEKIRELYAVALERDTSVSEPFTGLTRFGGRFRILGPTEDYYEQLLQDDLGAEDVIKASASTFDQQTAADETREFAAELMEPLDDLDTTSARNNSSVIALFNVADEYHLLSGDAGITALDHAAEEFESAVALLSQSWIEFFQVPHHGSRRNLGPSILDRWFAGGSAGSTAFISSALADKKHPGVAVIDELRRRNFLIHMTEGKYLRHHHEGHPREGYTPSDPV